MYSASPDSPVPVSHYMLIPGNFPMLGDCWAIFYEERDVQPRR